MSPKIKRFLALLSLPFLLFALMVLGPILAVCWVIQGTFKVLGWLVAAADALVGFLLGLVVLSVAFFVPLGFFSSWAWEEAKHGALDAFVLAKILCSIFGCYVVTFIFMRLDWRLALVNTETR